MHLDLSAAALVNAAGGAMFLLVGILALAWGRLRGRALLLGGLAATFGLLFVFENLVIGKTALESWWLTAFALPVIAFAVLLALDVARTSTIRERRALLVIGFVEAFLAATIAILVLVGLWSRQGPGVAVATALSVGTYTVGVTAVVTLLVAATMRAATREPFGSSKARGFLLLGAAFAPFLTFALTTLGATPLKTTTAIGAAVDLIFLVAAAFGIVVLILAASTPQEARLGRWLRAVLVAASVGGLVAVLIDPTVANSSGWGAYGVLRTIGAALLLVAIVKYDVLGVPLPRVAVSRGALAAGALATLFIVAQVAQNFLAAQYGLLMGSIVAGAFLFAASPLQRAMESIRERPTSVRAREPGLGSIAGGDARREAASRKSARWAMRDGRISRDEEIHLHELALQLGLDGRRAHEILVEVERETGVA